MAISILSFIISCQTEEIEKIEYAIVIHGGAGYMTPENLTGEKQLEYKDMLAKVTEEGLKVLDQGGLAVDAVETSIRIMEDSPLFNAGRGAVLTHDGINELDASIMKGDDLNAGAVAGVRTVKHPISASRKVMEVSEHVLLAGRGAEKFAEINGLEIVDPSYFFTQRRYDELLKVLEQEGIDTDTLKFRKFGTVGCVALDKEGNICAGTSTGGRTNKKFGRIGDSPLIGSGTYAKNLNCGVSATGIGEFFIRYAACHEISALMEYKGMTVQEAAAEVIHNQLEPVGGDGGVVCLDSKGHYAMEFNTSGMFRAYGNSEGVRIVAIF